MQVMVEVNCFVMAYLYISDMFKIKLFNNVLLKKNYHLFCARPCAQGST